MRKFVFMLLALSLTCGAFAREVKQNVAYRSDADIYVQQMCRLDISYEEGASDCPVIVWFHGGGLTSGAKHIPSTLTRDGAVVVAVGYRFVTKVDIAETIDDAAAAVAWVVNNISKYGGDTSKIYLAGHSAGGYLVDMIGLNKKYLEKYGVDANMFAALAPYSGQVITHFAHRSKSGVPALTPTIDEFAPLFHVRGDAAPMLIISADREQELYGRYEETAYFARMMKLNGHKDITFYELDGFSHNDMAEPSHLVLLKYIRSRK